MTEPLKFDPSELLEANLAPERVDEYFSLLMKENEAVNLVSRETTRVAFDRLVAESILPFEVSGKPTGSYLDIGSGGGFPAIPILLSQAGIKKATLIERTSKKAVALVRIADELSLPAKIVNQTLEEVNDLGTFDLITLRYVKLDRRLLTHIERRLKIGGRFVYYSQPAFDCSPATPEVYKFVPLQGEAIKSFAIFTK